MKKLLILTINDYKNIFRDPILLFMIVMPLFMPIFGRFLIPFLFSFIPFLEFYKYTDLLTVFLISATPLLTGFVTGFTILDEIDDNTISYISITPVKKTGYFFYKIFHLMILSFLYSIFTILFLGYISIPFVNIIFLSLIISLQAPLVALFLAVFSNNKVEGMVFAKGLGFFFLAPILEFFIDNPFTKLLFFVPFYWQMIMVKYIISKNNFYFFICFIIALVIHLFYLFLFIKKFEKKAF